VYGHMNINYIFWEDIPTDEFIVQQLSDESSEAILTFSRDENYRLLCDIKTLPGCRVSWDNNFGLDRKAGELHSNIQGINAATRQGHLTVRLEIFPTGWQSFSPKEVTYKPEAVKITLCPKVNSSNDTKTIVYFFLSNMGRGDIDFPNSMSFETSGKARIQMADTIDDLIEMPMLSRHSHGCFKMQINGKKFILGKVDKESTKNLDGVFLRFEKDSLPSDDELIAITNFLVYITGSEMIRIGHIKFGEHYSINEQVFLSTFRNDVKAVMCHSPMPVIPLGSKIVGSRYVSITNEDELSDLLSKYVKSKDIFSLDYIGYYLKCFRRLSVDIQMHPLSTALDLIQKEFFKSEKSPSKGKPSVDDALSKYLPLIENVLGAYPKKERIIGKIKNANEFTLNERLNVFFDEIGLKVGEFEKEIIKQRHKSIHGDLGGKDYQKLLFLVYGAYSLLNRIILKLIGHIGYYVDYSTYDFPCKSIDEPLSGLIVCKLGDVSGFYGASAEK